MKFIGDLLQGGCCFERGGSGGIDKCNTDFRIVNDPQSTELHVPLLVKTQAMAYQNGIPFS